MHSPLAVKRNPRDRRAHLTEIWTYLIQSVERHLCRNPWMAPVIPSLGQCFFLSHPCLTPFRFSGSTRALVWSVHEPRRFKCLCEAERAGEPPPFQRAKLCGRQAMFDHTLDVSEHLIDVVEHLDDTLGVVVPTEGICWLRHGWRRCAQTRKSRIDTHIIWS